jgi:TRAP-type uncharacterized transport system substrate-binding protein
MPWNLIDHPGLLRWSKIKGKKVLTGPKGTSLHVSAGLVWSMAPFGGDTANFVLLRRTTAY